MYKKILLPIDGSENSKRAAEHAINLADISNGDITVLFVIEPNFPKLPLLPISTLPTPDENYYEELREEGKKIIREFEEEIEKNLCKDKCQNINFTIMIREGKAYIEIVETIDEDDFDLVVMGASGRHSTLDRLVLGSVTERVIRETRIAVMVIP
jgi:nucleotide-binding universal stress UspA family protein